MTRSTLLRLALVCILLGTVLMIAQATMAQPAKPQCDLEAVIKHQNEHAQELANFAEQAKDNLDCCAWPRCIEPRLLIRR